MTRLFNDTRARRRLVSAATLLSSTMLAGTAFAADGAAPSVAAAAAAAAAPAAAPPTVSEVIVTAQKRAENIQRVPMNIQALDTKKLEQLNVNDFQDFVKFLPSVSFQTTGPSQTSIYMRGVASGENGNHSGPLPSVGTYLDEQPITTIGGTIDVHVYDIARVESLAGPQGTLYGASSESGTLRIITNKPTTAGFSAGYDLQANEVGPHGDLGYVAEGFVNQPITSNTAIRLVGFYEHDGGFIDNVAGTRTFPTSGGTINNASLVKKDFNPVDTIGGRGALKIDLDENWTIMPTIMGQVQRASGVFNFDPQVGDLKVHRFQPDTDYDRWYQAALTVTGKIGRYDLTYSGGYFHRQQDTQSDYSDYSYWYDKVNGSGAFWTGSDGVTPLNNPSQEIIGHDEFTKQSHELRIASPKEDRLRFVGGLFWQRQTHWIIQDYKVPGLGDSISVDGHPGTIWLTDQMRIDRDAAVFAEVTYDLTDKLSITGGIRGYEARNTLRGFYGFNGNFFAPLGEAQCFQFHDYRGAPCINLDKTVDGTGETHKVNLTYKFDPNKLVYFTYATGFRPGGVNRNGSLPPYQADTLSSYELGTKLTLLNHRLRLNADIYQEDWDNFQFSFLGPASLTIIANAGQARVRGAETDWAFAVTPQLTWSGAAAFTQAKLTAPYCGANGSGQPITSCPNQSSNPAQFDPLPPQAPVGQQLPVTPKWKFNTTLRYAWDIGEMKSHLQGSLVYSDAAYADLRTFERGLLGEMPAWTTLDLSWGIDWGNTTFEIFAKNVTDARGNVTRTAACTLATKYFANFPAPGNQVGICGQQPYITPIVPRMVGVRFGQRF
jgi:outer membrane receptor protein involved in Fe transport